MVSAGTYILGVLATAAVVFSLGLSALRIRRRLLPEWEGAPARLVEAVVGVALLIWLSELLGALGLFYAWLLIASSLLLAAATAFFWRAPSRGGGGTRLLLGGGAVGEPTPEEASATGGGGSPTATGPASPQASAPHSTSPLMLLITVGVIAVVFAHWGLTAKDALDRGIFNFDSLWYHMPFAVEMAQSHSVTGLHYTETVFTNWFYPQNSEILHAAGILLTERDTLSLFLNFGWLAVVFLAAWCIGRPYGRGHLSVIAVAILLECHTLVVREPGAAKNDLVAAGLLLAAIAILINAWAPGKRSLLPGWALAAAGLAVGLAVGTKSTTLGIVAALTVAVLVLAPTGKRWAAAAWWFLPAFAGGGFWYLRNLIVAGNPQPQIEGIGPISLPHPDQLQSGRPDFSIAHYATDTGVWREYFGPGLEQALGALWPLVIAAALAGAVLALLRGRDRIVRWSGGVALLGMLIYLFTPLSASGLEGEPVGFALNIRYAIPALLAGLALLPIARAFDGERRQWALIAAFLLVLLATDRSDAVLRDPARFFGLLVALLAVLIPAALLLARHRGAPRGAVAAGFAILALAVAAIGYPLQRDYLQARFGPDAGIPEMDLNSAYLWAGDIEDSRIGLAGTTAGFLQYGFYGRDLSNRVVYLGNAGPHGAFNPIPTCREFRAAVNAADLDYLVTSPFLNFIHTEDPIASPEAGWLLEDPAVRHVERSATVTVWRVTDRLQPAACGPRNAPLRRVPRLPSS